MNPVPLVSICVITYNHQDYISQAIEGFLLQKTTFAVEVIIHDDASTDNTAGVIKEYEKKHPGFIKPIYQKQNIYSQGGRPLIEHVFPKSRGKYIALCEGDDYWTDPYKLQKQVDFLESDENYSASAHQSKVIYENNNKASHLFNNILAETDFITEDLLGLRKFHTASFMFRSKILKGRIEEILKDILSGDRAIFLTCSLEGPIRFYPKAMCVYRKNESGISNRITLDLLKKDLNLVLSLSKIYPKFPKNRYKAYIYRTTIEYPEKVRFWPLLKHYFLHVWYSFSYFPENLHEMRGSLRIFIRQLKKNL